METTTHTPNTDAWPNKLLECGAIIGHTTSRSARLWLRTGSPGKHTLILYPRDSDADDRFARRFSADPYPLPEESALPDGGRLIRFIVPRDRADTTKVLDLTGLRPGCQYVYALHGNREGRPQILLGRERIHSFRTFPNGHQDFSFALLTCHMPYKKSLFGHTRVVNDEMWEYLENVLARHRDEVSLVAALGDQVYSDGIRHEDLNLRMRLEKTMRRDGGELLPDRDTMVAWYREVYRAYWGFLPLRRVYSSFPTYMMWDDHEIMDGWGSYKWGSPEEIEESLEALLPNWFKAEDKKGLSNDDARILLDRMHDAACQVYEEYQNCHNPRTPDPRQWDYPFRCGAAAYYILDGRGYRDVNRPAHRILGEDQMHRFEAWLDSLKPKSTPFVFIGSAVPVIHLTPKLVNADNTRLAELMSSQDDMRDHWEHHMHNEERARFLAALFRAAARGLKVCILSGDVHMAAAFKLRDPDSGAVIYQITSSAITYNVPRISGWLTSLGVPDDGTTSEGYEFERLMLYTGANFGLLRVRPAKQEVVFQLYSEQVIHAPEFADEARPMPHSLAKLKLDFS